MKKILKFSLVTILLLSFLIMPQNTRAETNLYGEAASQLHYSVESQESVVEPYDSLDNIFRKKQIKESCGSHTRTPIIEELEEYQQPYNSNMTSQIRISNAGSRVVMPFVNGILNFGYCHVFEGHMEFSDGTKSNKVNGKNQFQNAQYPETTMKIIMEVINGTTELIPEQGNKFSKTKYSKTERQNVKVILRRGKDVTAGNYSAYDWVVVTAYPI